MNVIPVQKKKQRVNDYYLEPDSNYDSEADEDDYDSEDDRHLFDLYAHRDREIPHQELNTMPRDLIDDLAEDKLTNYCRRTFRAYIDSWQDVLIIPARNLDTVADITRGRVSRLPR